MSESQIAQIWNEINQILQLDCGQFSNKLLTTRGWYLQVLQIIYPFLADKLNKIAQIQSQEAAIDRMLLLLTQQQIIQEDFLQIKGCDIISGDSDSIFYVVQLLNALVERALEQAEGQQPEQNEQHQDEEQLDDQHQNDQQVPFRQQQSANKKKYDTGKQLSDPGDQRGCHSVLGIGHQFQENQGSESQNYNQLREEDQRPVFNNVFPEKVSPKIHNNNYQNNLNFQSGPAKNQHMKITNYKNQQQDDNEQYLEQKLQKHKSEDVLKVVKKQKEKKKKTSNINQNKVNKLVTHPQIPKTYNKAVTYEEKKLTEIVKKTVLTAKKKTGEKQNYGVKQTGAQVIDRKRRQLKNYLSVSGKAAKRGQGERKIDQLKEKNNQKLKKLLKWKQANLKKQKHELELDMEMKVQLKKQLYVKKINNLILTLEKNRMIQRKKEQQEREKRQKQLAHKRLGAIQTQYRNQMKLIHQKSDDKLNKKIAHTDHRTIIEGLEKELKKENQKQIVDLKMRFRREEAQLQDDLEKLQSEIIRAYKKN